MKKIFYILAAAIVALGTVACENEGLDNITPPNINVNGDTVSFVAGINRTDLDGAATVWDADDTIVVTWNEKTYEFKNAGQADENTFSCTAEGLSAIVNAESIKAVYSNNNDGKVDSAAGTAGAVLEYEGAFNAIAFEVKNAFLKFTNAEAVTLTASEGLFGEGTELVIEEAGEHYVAINPVAATLEYKVGESMGKNLETTFEAKKVYNLGNLTKSIAGDSNGKYYTELATAFKLAESGATITLFENITLDAPLSIEKGKEYTLDLGEHTLSYSDTAWGTAMIRNNGTLTIENGTVAYTFEGEPDTSFGKGNYVISNAGTLTIESDAIINNLTAKMSHANYAVDNNSVTGDANMTVKGTINAENITALRQYASTYANNLTIVEGATVVGGQRAVTIHLPSNNNKVAPEVSLNITGGTITTKEANGIVLLSQSGGNSFANTTINIEGENTVMNGDIYLTSFYESQNDSVEKAVTIKGGTFNMYNYIFSYALWFTDTTMQENIQVTGGKFNKEPYEGYYGYHLADGYTAKFNGEYYEIVEWNPVASVGGVEYESFDAALAAAEAGATIELLADVGDVTISKACTFTISNPNSYTINIIAGTGFGVFTEGSTYTILKQSDWEISDGTRFYCTSTEDLFVAKNVKLSSNSFCLHKVGDTAWGAGAKYGLVTAATKSENTAIGVYSANWAGDITISNATTTAHDIYFDKANSRVYVLTVGKTPSEIAAPTSTTTYGLIGSFNSWGSDVLCTYAGDNVWHITYTFKANDEFKVRKNKDWTTCYGHYQIQSSVGRSYSNGSDNAKMKAAGTYEIWVIPSHSDAPLYIIKK